MTIAFWIEDAIRTLNLSGISSARLDAELILAETLQESRTFLHAHSNDTLNPQRCNIANARISLRAKRVPLAYILGRKDFYGRTFLVSPDVLIPRPESEDMITSFLSYSTNQHAQKTLIDVGTGSGCLGITAALECPTLRVILSDIDHQALRIAHKNAHLLHATIKIQHQSLLSKQVEPVDYIFANLPYVDRSWETSPELTYEPALALYADEGGLYLILQLIRQATHHLNRDGFIFIEADPEQHHTIITEAVKNNLSHVITNGYCCVFQKSGYQSQNH